MDIRAKNLWQTERIDDWIETLRIGIAAMRNAIHNKEMDIFCSAEAMEERYFLSHPFRPCRMGRAYHHQILGSLQPLLQLSGQTARLYISRCEEYRFDRIAFPAMLTTKRGGHAVALQLALQSLSPRGVAGVVGDEGEEFVVLHRNVFLKIR